jgi:hypothetical protein
MLASSINGFDKVCFVAFDADDISNLVWLDMADIVLEQFIVREYLTFKVGDHIKEVDGSF